MPVQDWSTVKIGETSTQEALDKLTEAAALYERYLEITGIHTYHPIAEVELVTEEPPHHETPLGLVLNPSPIGFSILRRS